MIDISLSMLLARYRIFDVSSLTVVLSFPCKRTVKPDPLTTANMFIELLERYSATCVHLNFRKGGCDYTSRTYIRPHC